jgi:LPPG:FO 2-phospho-L-lactate transferase
MAIERVVALAGGVGGAKLAQGLAQILPPTSLKIIVNIGDDFRHYGLQICPDLDTVMYTLSGQANSQTGWGVKDESWATLGMLQTYGEAPWFRLGDKDIATHLIRSSRLAAGHRLTDITHDLSRALGVGPALLPASDDPLATMLETDTQGTLNFQEYFVRHRWQPPVKRIWYEGAATARPSPEVLAALEEAQALVICPSNPLLSIDPILAIGGLSEIIRERKYPSLAVSPLIGGKAVKGPADKLMTELGYDPSTTGLLDYYAGLIDVLVVDSGEAPLRDERIRTAPTLMQTESDRAALAKQVLTFLGDW